jgi:hypothetical protein
LKAAILKQRALLLFSLPRQQVIPIVFPASFPVQTPEEGQNKIDKSYHLRENGNRLHGEVQISES